MSTAERATVMVTLTLPTSQVERKYGRDGHPFWLARLPKGTHVGAHDLSNGLVCSEVAYKSRTKAGITHLELPADADKTVKLPQRDLDGMPVTVKVAATDLCKAVAEATSRSRWSAALRRAADLLDMGNEDLARQTLGTVAKGSAISRPTAATRDPKSHRWKPGLTDIARAYEAAGILPAWLPTCSVNTHAATAAIPDGFTHVAIAEGKCVSRECFERLLNAARSHPPRHGGALEEHSIGYVARQIARPFARAREREIVEVNGEAFDVTGEVLDVPGALMGILGEETPKREVTDLGAAALSVDRLSLVERLDMSVEEADAVADWMGQRFESDLALAVGRVGVAHVDALLRSPAAVALLAKSGVRMENPVTGERMAMDYDKGEVSFGKPGHVSRQNEGRGTDLFDWQCLKVASDDAWRVVREDAIRLCSAADGPAHDLMERARSEYLHDDWLKPRERAENVPTYEGAKRLLARRDVGQGEPRSYQLDEAINGLAQAGARIRGEAPRREAVVAR